MLRQLRRAKDARLQNCARGQGPPAVSAVAQRGGVGLARGGLPGPLPAVSAVQHRALVVSLLLNLLSKNTHYTE